MHEQTARLSLRVTYDPNPLRDPATDPLPLMTGQIVRLERSRTVGTIGVLMAHVHWEDGTLACLDVAALEALPAPP